VSAGGIAGIVVGGAAVIAGIGWLLWRRRQTAGRR
jgi:LPXTG-motif cell wall-anchored protein